MTLKFSPNSLSLDGVRLHCSGVDRHIESEIAFIEFLASHLRCSAVWLDGGMLGYTRRAKIVGTVDNSPFSADLFFGARNIGQHVLIAVSGSMTQWFCDQWAELGIHFSVTRADIALDFQGNFMDAYKIVKSWSIRKRRKTSFVGDWDCGLDGRTYYSGARGSDSETFIRLYEKGIESRQKGYTGVPTNWQRLELEFRPRKAKRKDIIFLDARSMLGYAHSVLELFNRFSSESFPPVDLSGLKLVERTSLDSFRHMLSQYSKVIQDVELDHGRHFVLETFKSVLTSKD